MAKILLAESNAPGRDMLSRGLERYGHNVLTAGDGERAVAMAGGDAPDVIVMDLNLPVLDGWAAAQRIKSAAATRGIPVIGLTAHPGEERDHALKGGCDEFDTRPIDLPRLLGKIDAVLHRERPAPARAPAAATSRPAAAPCEGRILVVDDTAPSRDVLARRLAKAGYRVDSAGDGPEALRLAAANPYDLILLDVMMPKMNGFEVLAELRRDHAATDLPVIMATARDGSDDIAAALGGGANDYVIKPLDFTVVLARVKTQIILKRSVQQIRTLETDLKQRNRELQSANAKLHRDLDAAARVQAALLPAANPNIPGYAFAWLFNPSAGLAGDIFNVFRLDDRHAGMYVLDVSGHGVAAALLSVTVSRFLSPVAQPTSMLWERSADGQYQLLPPARVAEKLGERFPFDDGTQQYFTLVYGVLDLHEHRLSYVSAGHPNLVYLSRGQPPALLEASGYPIGVGSPEYDEYAIDLHPGDGLCLYSDGVPEAMNESLDVLGYNRMLTTLRDVPAHTAEQTIAALAAAIQAWSGMGKVQDDQTVLCVQRL